MPITFSEEKELKNIFKGFKEINEKIRKICIKASLNTEEFGFDQQKYEIIKSRQGIFKRFSVLSQILSKNENAPSSNSRLNLSKKQTLLRLPKLECVKFSGVKPSKFEFKNFLAQFQNCNAFGVEWSKVNIIKKLPFRLFLTINITFDIGKL